MKRDILLFAVLPGIVLAMVTLLRARLELAVPDSPWTAIAGVNIPTLLLVPALCFVLRRRPYKQFLLLVLLLLLLIRIPVGLVYFLAWAGSWEVEGTGQPVRYITDFARPDGTIPGLAPWQVGLVATLGAVAAGMLVAAALGYLLRRSR